mmetsp:Transcript_10243/g.21699  ORF Transcript_10243/g.21699 Transcript_10243/m.21699 type:complete len:126 (-) Transcript_10243:3437-3814(-)
MVSFWEQFNQTPTRHSACTVLMQHYAVTLKADTLRSTRIYNRSSSDQQRKQQGQRPAKKTRQSRLLNLLVSRQTNKAVKTRNNKSYQIRFDSIRFNSIQFNSNQIVFGYDNTGLFAEVVDRSIVN